MLQFLRRVWLDGRLFLSNHIVSHIPSHTLRLLFYRAVMRAKIGADSRIFMGACLDWPGGLVLGDLSVINENCRLDCRGGLTIGSRVSISAQVCFLTAEHDIKSRDFSGIEAPIVVEDYVFIGTRAMILPGITLGKGCVVAAGAVVTKDVPPFDIVGGVPAKKIGDRPTDLEYDCRYSRLFH